MATLVLTSVGSLVGGPIGGAIGALIGNRIDRRLLAPKGRQGPRLGDLAVQTSAYGQMLPKLFGTMRVAGTVIWATDLREEAHASGGGKSGGRTTNYSYSASFAVACRRGGSRASGGSGPTASCCAGKPATGRARPGSGFTWVTRARRSIR